jgi:hypothetical protein
MPVAVKPAALGLAIALLVTPAAWAADNYSGFAWMSGAGGGDASLDYGSPETGEDYVFGLICRNKSKITEMTVYVDIAGTKVGDPLAIELKRGDVNLSLAGKIATDEMSGFLFAEAKAFKIKPILALLEEKGPVTVKTGGVLTTLPDDGRFKATAEFAKSCSLD